jgi:hypothetical protein
MSQVYPWIAVRITQSSWGGARHAMTGKPHNAAMRSAVRQSKLCGNIAVVYVGYGLVTGNLFADLATVWSA